MSIKEIFHAIKKLKKRAKKYHAESRVEIYGSSVTIYLRDPCGESMSYDIPVLDYAHFHAAKAWIKAHLKMKQAKQGDLS